MEPKIYDHEVSLLYPQLLQGIYMGLDKIRLKWKESRIQN
jgi:hypothetical protein